MREASPLAKLRPSGLQHREERGQVSFWREPLFGFRSAGVPSTKSTPSTGALPMQSQESDGIAAFLSKAVSDGASSGQVAEAVTSAFKGIDQALTPIIGKRGVAALYKRTVHLAGRTHPWLAVPMDGVPTVMDVAALTGALQAQPAADAAAAGTLLLQAFDELLTTLVGPSLTERLLRPVWAVFLSGPSAKDTTT